ncbi:MAG: ABC transporter substrate-binding protein [Acidobacteriota bacterium]
MKHWTGGRSWFVVGSLALAALLSACAPAETRIGCILPLTGHGSVYGKMAKKGVELAVEEINTQGGLRGKPLQVLYRDSRSRASAGLKAATDLIDTEGVNAILGDLLSEVTLEVAKFCEKRQVVLFSPAASTPKLTQAGLYIFRNYPSDVLEGAYLAQFASEKLRLLDLVVIAVANAYGQGLKESFLRYYTGPNREVHKVIAFPDGDPDLREIANAVESINPDGIYLIAYDSDRRKILETLRGLGAGARILATRDSRDLIKGAGELIENVIFPLDDYDPESQEPATREFVRNYSEKYNGEVPGLWAAQAYDAMRMLGRAVDEAKGTYGQDVQITLSTMKGFRGATGITDLDANGDVTRYPKLYIVKDGNFVPYDEYEAAQTSDKG